MGRRGKGCNSQPVNPEADKYVNVGEKNLYSAAMHEKACGQWESAGKLAVDGKAPGNVETQTKCRKRITLGKARENV